MKKIILTCLLCFLSLIGLAQQATFINTTFNINADKPITWYGDVTFGPKAVVYIEDEAYAVFFGKNMNIDPEAKFIALPGNNQIGTGVIIFKGNNPNYPGYPLQQTLNGGYTNSSDPSLINIEVDNAEGISLDGNVRIANQVKFTQGHIFLNNFNLVLGNEATLTNFDVKKHIVTNGSGVLTKEGLANGASFLFPVSIAGTDFTPATITNTANKRAFSVQVKNYSSSIALESTFITKGIDRTWQVTSNTSGTANIALQHNTANNINGLATNESGFNNQTAYVSQQLAPGVWTESCTGANGGTPISITVGNEFIVPSTLNATAYFSKRTVTCTDLSIAKSVDNSTPSIGANLTFTLTVSNLGTANIATGVVVNDLLPTGYTFVSATPSTGSYVATTGVWTIGTMASGATATLSMVATINAAGSYVNTASVSGNEIDFDLSNNTATVTPVLGAQQANLGVVKTVNNLRPSAGDNLVFTIAASNVGPNAATGVTVTDVLPSGYVFVSANASTGTYNNATGVWLIGNFANGANATLTIAATIKATGSYSNTATISGDEIDPVPGNNISTVTPALRALVDLTITKTAINKITAISDVYDYTITVKNVGSSLASQVLATDVLPVGIAYVSSSTTYGAANYNAATRAVNWVIGNLAASGTITLTIKVKAIVKGIVVNTATVTSFENDLTANNNTSSHTKEIFDITFANTFTPNGDGKNDTFMIAGLDNYPQNSLKIFNRWGNEVWSSRGSRYQNDWNGNGLKEGTYYYTLSLKDALGSWQVVTGWILLLRDQ